MKIILNEEQQNRLKLPPFIYKAIATKRTSIGDNPALPPYGDFGFEYDIIKSKFEEFDDVINKQIEMGRFESKDSDYLISTLSKKIEECKKIENTISPQLEKLCENIINAIFSVPEDTVIFRCKLVGKIKPKNSLRILPEEDNETNSYDFEDADEVDLTNKVILKRRFINSLIQGISYWLSTDINDWYDTVYELNNDLWELWIDIINITNYLLFTKEEKISEKNPNQLSYVEVHLGKVTKKTVIESQGIIFPFLLRDSIRGFLELFSSHGLPEDNKKAMYIIRKSDFLVAEPWDLRLGMGIIDILKNNLTEKYQTGVLYHTNRIPFFFTELCSLSTDEFNMVMKNFILGTKKGKLIAKKIDSDIVHDFEYQEFKDKIQQKNIKASLISDGDFSKEELDGYVLQENGLCESQESKSISAAKMLLMNSFNCDEESADEEIRINLRNRVPILKTKSGSKFILGVARMFACGQLDEKKLNDIIAYIINKGIENEFDRNLNGLSCGEMVKMFSKELKNDLLNRKNQINSIKFNKGPQEYNIVRIDSFDDAIQYSKYCDWCITTHEDAYVQNSNDGIYQIYFCLRKGYKREKPIVGENAPLDNYGLSMISVIVNERGDLVKCTSRWNHSNGGSDYVMNENEISKLINKNFYEVFKPNNNWAKGVERAKRLLRKYDIYDVFDEVEDLGYGFYGVSYYERWNIINSNKRLISKIWFDSNPREFSNGYSVVSKNDMCNFIDFKGNFLFSTWFSECFEFDKNGIGWVKVMKYYYPVNMSGKFLSNKGYDDIGLTSENGFICVYKDGKCNFLNNSLNEISTVWYDYASKFENGIAEVWLDNKCLYIDVNGNPVSNPITENLETEIMAYHGSGADFDKFNHKKYLSTGAGSQCFGWGTYVTNDKAIAKGYSDSSRKTIFNEYEVTKEVIFDKFINDYHFDENTATRHTNNLWKIIGGGANIDYGLAFLEDVIDTFDTPKSRKEIYEMYQNVLNSFNMQKTDVFLYEVDIPEDNGINYIEWYKDFPKEQMKKVLYGFLKINDKHLNKMADNNYPFKCELYQSIQFMKKNPDKVEKMIDILSNDERYDTFFSIGFYTRNPDTEGKNVYGRLRELMGSDKAASLFLMYCGFDGIKYPSGTRWQKPDGASEDAYNYVIFDANKVKIINKTKV